MTFDLGAIKRRAGRTRPGVDGVRPLRAGLPRIAYEDREVLIEEVERLRLEVGVLQTTLRDTLAAGEMHKATVERVHGAIRAQSGLEPSRVLTEVRMALDPAAPGSREEG